MKLIWKIPINIFKALTTRKQKNKLTTLEAELMDIGNEITAYKRKGISMPNELRVRMTVAIARADIAGMSYKSRNDLILRGERGEKYA